MVRVDNKALDRVSNEELKALATDLAVTPQQILRWKQGSIPSPAELYATRVIVHQGRQKIVALARAALRTRSLPASTTWLRHSRRLSASLPGWRPRRVARFSSST
jgi:hypothetical protein